jgi:hypothetical protein
MTRRRDRVRAGRPQGELPEELDAATINYVSWLRTARLEAGVTLSNAARRTSVSRETLRRLEAGQIIPISRKHAREHAIGIGLDIASADAEHAKYVAAMRHAYVDVGRDRIAGRSSVVGRIGRGLGILAALVGAAAAFVAIATSIKWAPVNPPPPSFALRELRYEADPYVTRGNGVPNSAPPSGPEDISQDYFSMKPGCIFGDEIRVNLDKPVIADEVWDEIVIAEEPAVTLSALVHVDPLLARQLAESKQLILVEVWGDGRLLERVSFDPRIGQIYPLNVRISGVHRLLVTTKLDRDALVDDCKTAAPITLEDPMVILTNP